MSKYINTDWEVEDDEGSRIDELSRTGQALLLPLMVMSNKDNEIDKHKFIKTVNWITDYRTWEKYWKELVEKKFLVRLDDHKWMVSPHECYAEDSSHNALILKWNEANNAIN